MEGCEGEWERGGRWRDGMGWTRIGKEGKGGIALRCVACRDRSAERMRHSTRLHFITVL